MLQAFFPPPFQNADQERHNLLCPVRALDAYVHRAALWRKNEQLFVCFGPPNKGSPASKQRMSKWVVEAISLAYESAGQPSPMAVRSHSTRSMATSKALISGVALQEVCDVAGWSSPHTFIRFYSYDLDSTPGSQVLSSLCCSFDFTQDRHSSLWWCCINIPLVSKTLTQRSSLERERSVMTITLVPWRGNKHCVPGHPSFVPVGNLLRL